MAAGTTRGLIWGPAYPDAWDTAIKFWGPAYGEPTPNRTFIAGVGPDGVATFALDIEGLELTFTWVTDVFKSYSGLERRQAILDRPKRHIEGSALLVGDSMRSVRSKLQQFAALGQPFLLGLPFEGLLLTQDSVSYEVYVDTIANQDWINVGQRVIIIAADETSVEGVIQSSSGSTIVLDVVPGATGVAGGVIMPLVAVALAPQQGFARYVTPEGVERWGIVGDATLFGFQVAATPARLDLESVSGGGNLADTFAQAKVAGIAGNAYNLSFVNDAVAPDEFAVVNFGTDIEFHFDAGTTTVARMVEVINALAEIEIVGEPSLAQVLSSADEFSNEPLTGGTGTSYGTDGTGATVVTHTSVDGVTRPVFDRYIRVEDTAPDSLQAMNEVIDLGGVPITRGQATIPDWGRHISIQARYGPEWQWFKKFMSTVCGRQKSFYVPTWRADLEYASGTGTTLIINDTEDSAFFTWFATRKSIQVRQTNGTITYAKIDAAVDNADGTITLTLGTAIPAGTIEMISWLDLCRFESDTITVEFSSYLFQFSTLARTVQR
jgi:hypothetical protein